MLFGDVRLFYGFLAILIVLARSLFFISIYQRLGRSNRDIVAPIKREK